MMTRYIRILPWLLTVAVFALLLRRVPLDDVVDALQAVPVAGYLGIMLPYSICYCTIDAFVLTRILNWFHAPVAFRRVLPVRAAAYILALLNPSLGHGAVAVALHRRQQLPLLGVTGSLMFLTVMEVTQLALYAAAGIFLLHPMLWRDFAPVYILLAMLIAGIMLCVRRGIDPIAILMTKLGRWYRNDPTYQMTSILQRLQLLQAFRQAGLKHYLLTLLFKSPNFLLALVAHHFALRLFQVHIPFIDLMAFLPVIFLVASLPITVAHLGTTQGAWLYFFSDYGTPSQLLAYSLVSHLTFMVLNGLIGLGFLRLALVDIAGQRLAPEP